MDNLQPFVVELHLGSPLVWLGLVLSVLGVGLTLRTLQKTRSAAEATTEAVGALKDSLAKVDRIAACSTALVALGEIKRLQRSSNWDLLPDRYSNLRQLLVQIRSAKPALGSEHNRGLQSVLAQLGNPDMRTPIAHALDFPSRIAAGVPFLDLARIGTLRFEAPDLQRFPCLRLAYQALAAGGSAPTAMNAANEVAVAHFLSGEISLPRIPAIIEEVLSGTDFRPARELEDIMEADARARAAAERLLGRLRPPADARAKQHATGS